MVANDENISMEKQYLGRTRFGSVAVDSMTALTGYEHSWDCSRVVVYIPRRYSTVARLQYVAFEVPSKSLLVVAVYASRSAILPRTR